MVETEGGMADIKRRNDPENADHRHERRFDWREMAPRWAMVTAIAVLLASSGFLWGKWSSADDERVAILAKYQSDARWDLLTRLSEEQAIQRARLNHHDAQLAQLVKVADDVADIRADTRAMRRQNDEMKRRY